MKVTILFLSLLAAVLSAILASAQVSVDPYAREDGAQGRGRTSPNATMRDNSGISGSDNPNTGQVTGGDPNRIDRNPASTADVPQSAPRGRKPSGNTNRKPFGNPFGNPFENPFGG
jgi:hypothetical protein